MPFILFLFDHPFLFLDSYLYCSFHSNCCGALVWWVAFIQDLVKSMLTVIVPSVNFCALAFDIRSKNSLKDAQLYLIMSIISLLTIFSHCTVLLYWVSIWIDKKWWFSVFMLGCSCQTSLDPFPKSTQFQISFIPTR